MGPFIPSLLLLLKQHQQVMSSRRLFSEKNSTFIPIPILDSVSILHERSFSEDLHQRKLKSHRLNLHASQAARKLNPQTLAVLIPFRATKAASKDVLVWPALQ